MSILKRSWYSTLAIVLVATCLNGVKPVHIDDTAYLRFAEQIVADPAHPYAFEMFWYDAPQPAIEVLAPPVYLYWLALGVWAAPGNPAVWHLMVFPWLLLLACSLNWLAERWRGGTSPWLVAAFVFSPVVLPGINLMLDIPALALALASLVLFTKSLDKQSLGASLLAGVVLAVAFETKYTAATMFPVWLGVAWLSASRRRWPCLLAGWGAAVAGITLVEGLIAWGHGQSHLLLQLSLKRDRFPTPIVVYLCQIALAVPAIPLVGLARSWSRRSHSPLCSASLMTLPLVWGLLAIAVQAGALSVMYATFLGVSWLMLFVVPWVVNEKANQSLLYWYFACELIYCVFVSPFPAMRRVLGPAVPLTLLMLGGAQARSERALRWLAGVSVACGLGIWGLDFQEAHLQRQAAVTLAEKYQKSDRTIWFAGHWGWEFYAGSTGMESIVPGRSVVQKGDIIVVPTEIYHQSFEVPTQLRHLESFLLPSRTRLPVTLRQYYGGALQLIPEAHQGFAAEVYHAESSVRIPPCPRGHQAARTPGSSPWNDLSRPISAA